VGNTRQWEWSTKKEAAAALLAEDSLSIRRIAQQLGTSESTVDRWKKVPEFQTRTREHIAAFRAKVLECGLARKKSRLAALSDKCGGSAEMKLVAGGSSGLITSTVSQHMGNTSNWEWSRKK